MKVGLGCFESPFSQWGVQFRSWGSNKPQEEGEGRCAFPTEERRVCRNVPTPFLERNPARMERSGTQVSQVTLHCEQKLAQDVVL